MLVSASTTLSLVSLVEVKGAPKKSFDSLLYRVRSELRPQGLDGISDAQIEDHWNLYVGYVTQTNALNAELKSLRDQGNATSAAYADRRRRYGFEYNGMVLHELYFANMQAGHSQPTEGPLFDALVVAFGSFEAWRNDFIQAGKTRGIGWVILYLDPATGTLINTFVGDHEIGNIVGFMPILVMDVWEHAYMVDHRAGGRSNYIEAFMRNINWPLVMRRHERVQSGGIPPRFDHNV
jgi:Fe-Mn family superoxide dismutase